MKWAEDKAKRDEEVARLQKMIEENNRASDEERARWLQKMEEIQQPQQRTDFRMFGRALNSVFAAAAMDNFVGNIERPQSCSYSPQTGTRRLSAADIQHKRRASRTR